MRGSAGLLRKGLGGLMALAMAGGLLMTGTAANAAPEDGDNPYLEMVTGKDAVSSKNWGPARACTPGEVRATKRWWVFGDQNKFDFGLSGSAAPKASKTTGLSVEGSTVVTDTEGNLQFYSNGIDVWGADGKPLKNSGGGKGMSSSAQTVVAMPALGSPGKYYVVTSGYQAEMGTAKASLYYSVVDMKANGGKGEMVEKNIPLGTAGVAGEGLSATVNAAGDGYWVYAVAANSRQIHRWQFKADGPVSKTPTSQTMTDTFASYSTIHFDEDWKTNRGVVLASNLNIYTMVTVNRSTGALTEGFRVKHTPANGASAQLYGATFAPGGRYMFFSDIYGTPSRVYRVDLTKTASAAALRDSRVIVGTMPNVARSGGGVKLGPDGNVWVNNGYGEKTVGKIANPTAATPSAMTNVALPGVSSGWGLPDVVTGCQTRTPQLTSSVTGPSWLTLDDAIAPVTVNVENTGDTALVNLSVDNGSCPVKTLAVGASTVCRMNADHYGTITPALNDKGSHIATARVRAQGSIGLDAATGKDMMIDIGTLPSVNLRVATVRTATFVTERGTIVGPTSMRSLFGYKWGSWPNTKPVPYVDDDMTAFSHWATEDGRRVELNEETVRDDITLYAYMMPRSFGVSYDGNAETGVVKGSMANSRWLNYCTDCALTPNAFKKSTGAPEMVDTEAGETGDVESKFLGWSEDRYARAPQYADGQSAVAMGQVPQSMFKLYAVWDDAPRFEKTYSDRYFTLREARTGKITEAELLKSITATDRETNPLVAKTKADVEATGSDVGITLYDFEADDYTRLDGEATITVTYKLKDEASNVAFLRIRVFVAPSRADVVELLKSTRGFSSEYRDAVPEEGGLGADSSWRTDPAKSDALDRALSDDVRTKYCLDVGAMDGIREDVRGKGLGKSDDPEGLEATKEALRSGVCQ